jgi:predicted flavoprotein YhiN
LSTLGVKIEVSHRWLGWAESRDGTVEPAITLLQDGRTIEVANDVTLLALGERVGPSRLDGSWSMYRAADVKVNDLRPANCGMRVEWTQHFAQRFAGVPLKNVAIDVNGLRMRRRDDHAGWHRGWACLHALVGTAGRSTAMRALPDDD